jgi:LysR family hydrogen peroxide-inducible transcriptional activator
MAALPSLRQLKYLVALAEHLNFTRAAEACFVGQSTLSTGLKELESTLGVQLVERDRQTVALTEVGVGVVQRARALLAAAEDMTDFASDAGQPLKARLRMGIIPTIAPFVLPELMPHLRKQFPQLQLALREDLTANLLKRLQDRQLDLVLMALPYDVTGFKVRTLFNDEFWLVAREDDAAVSGKKIQLGLDWTDRLLLLEEGHCLRDHALQACKGTEVANADGLEATSLLTLVQMVAAGMGLSLLPEMAVKSGLLNKMPLLARPLAAPAPRRTIAMVTRETSAHLLAFDAVAQTVLTLRKQHAHRVSPAVKRAHARATRLTLPGPNTNRP